MSITDRLMKVELEVTFIKKLIYILIVANAGQIGVNILPTLAASLT